jgi:hypothetical protein
VLPPRRVLCPSPTFPPLSQLSSTQSKVL